MNFVVVLLLFGWFGLHEAGLGYTSGFPLADSCGLTSSRPYLGAPGPISSVRDPAREDLQGEISGGQFALEATLHLGTSAAGIGLTAVTGGAAQMGLLRLGLGVKTATTLSSTLTGTAAVAIDDAIKNAYGDQKGLFSLKDYASPTNRQTSQMGRSSPAELRRHLVRQQELNRAANVPKGGAGLADDAARAAPNKVVKVGGRNPINNNYAGQTHPSGVQFKETGFPDFSPHAKAQVVLDDLTGIPWIDNKLANQAAGFGSSTKAPKGYVWHHVEDGRTMQLVPIEIHNAARHTGGAAIIRIGGAD